MSDIPTTASERLGGFAEDGYAREDVRDWIAAASDEIQPDPPFLDDEPTAEYDVLAAEAETLPDESEELRP